MDEGLVLALLFLGMLGVFVQLTIMFETVVLSLTDPDRGCARAALRGGAIAIPKGYSMLAFLLSLFAVLMPAAPGAPAPGCSIVTQGRRCCEAKRCARTWRLQVCAL